MASEVVEETNSSAQEDGCIIKGGETVILQKYNYMRTHVLNAKKCLQLGRDIVSMEGIEGKKYGTTFEMVSNPKNKKQFQLVEANEIVDFEELFLTGEGGQDNRDLQDTEATNQNLSREQIEELRDSGTAGKVIMEKIIENSDTFQQKTKFSQQKFLKKKAKKYHHYVMIRKPSIRLLMDILYKMDPMKIMNLRVDSLSQILNVTNVHSGGRYLVYETGAQGLVVAAVLERLGGVGELIHVYQTGQPQTTALNSVGLQKSPILKVLNIQHLRSMEQGRDILVNHWRTEDGDKPDSDEPPTKKSKQEQHSEANGQQNQPQNGESNGSANNCDTTTTTTTTQPQPEKTFRMNLREKSVEAFGSLKNESMDGLVLVCRQHPGNLLVYLSQFIKPSRPFCVYSPYKEPLLDAYIQVKEAGIAVAVNLSESWLRYHQVLPQRTHPMVNMSGGGGYLLSGIFIER